MAARSGLLRSWEVMNVSSMRSRLTRARWPGVFFPDRWSLVRGLLFEKGLCGEIPPVQKKDRLLTLACCVIDFR